MNAIKFIKVKITAFLLLFALAGCDLELDPLGNANGEQIWGSAQGCEQMLAGAYARLRKILIQERPLHIHGDLPANTVFWHGHLIHNQATCMGHYDGSYMEWYQNWSPYYQVITTVNTLLKHIDDIPLSEFDKNATEAKRKHDKLRGEAYFLHAFTYFYMVRIYGDVPLVKEAIESANQALQNGSTVPRKQSPEEEILDYLIQPVDAAIALLETDTPGSDTWAVHADRAAALNLKAHILMWRARQLEGTDPQAVEWLTQAEQALDIVINQSNRSLVDYNNPTAVTDMFDGESSEGIFELQISVAQNESAHVNAGEFHVLGDFYKDVSRQTLTGELRYSMPDPGMAGTLYPANDKRRTLFYQNFGKPMTDLQTPPFLLKYASHIEDDPSMPDRYFTNSNVLIFRLSESILLRAEALDKLGRKGNARQLLNTIRNRAGIGNFIGGDEELKVAIFEERARELAGEGHSAYDRIRMNYWEGMRWAMSAERYAKRGYYWPVPISELISANPDLYQVPWWVGKVN